MRKVVYPKVGGVDSIQIVEEDDLIPGHGEVCVRIHRAGINFADLMMRQGLYGSNPDYPFTPGYEAAGEILSIGEGVDGLSEGQRVLAMTGFGGYSEMVCLDSNRIIPLPDSVSFDQAAALPVTYGTAYHMLVYLGNLSEGDTVLVHHAAGGVGTAVAQICQAYGVSKVIGTASAPKKEFVESLGMHFVDSKSEDFVSVCKSLTDGKGVNHAIDPVGGKHLMRSYKALCRGGKLYCFGASSAVKGEKRSVATAMSMWATTPKFDPLKMMRSNKAVFGVHMGLLDDESIFKGHLEALSDMLLKGKIDPIIDSVWRFEQVSEAQKHMHDRKNRGKILLDFS
ncbi:MAG: zinc-binding dehydrogenase [Candidatus Thermoplasmatota archaeon]|jgi:NADPH:quinone reductase-like Zn-dependent oxidoreductase|nr:zinc-binding dehydrogenase [Candidatus Thermoplasmatota archaeon]|tara:strand:- start:505 stop:1521 length:1017 start_codon:yes stop_codon:yes gene_type:complete